MPTGTYGCVAGGLQTQNSSFKPEIASKNTLLGREDTAGKRDTAEHNLSNETTGSKTENRHETSKVKQEVSKHQIET